MTAFTFKKSFCLALAASVVVLSGCNKKTTATDGEIGGTIIVLTNRTDVVDTKFQEYKEAFEEKYPGTNVEFEAITDYEGTVRTRMSTKEYGDEWNFQHCREGITRFWRDGLRRNRPFENIYTVGMRGEADTAILGREATLKDNIDLLKDVLNTQYKLMKEEVNPNLNEIPRLLVMFSEVDKFYFGNKDTQGLKDTDLLDGVTIMMTDDNYGVLRALPDESMRNHKGGLGLYYHFDFHGGPHCYEWVNENYLPKAWEQLTTAYEWGIRDVWIVNVGDMGLLEFPLNYFMDMAYDYEKYGSPDKCNTKKWTHDWLYKQFGSYFVESDMQKMESLVQDYTFITNRCKPEVMNGKIYDTRHFGEADELFAKADKALYQVKQNGKHGYAIYESEYKDGDVPKTGGGLLAARMILSERNELPGAMDVGFEIFQALYRFLLRSINNYHKAVSFVLITVEPRQDEGISEEELTSYGNTFYELALKTLRKSDILTKRNNNTYMALLPEANYENSWVAIDRVMTHWEEEHRDMSLKCRIKIESEDIEPV